MDFRAWVAAQRHLGFEMDPRELSEAEIEVPTEVTRWWKGNRDWLMNTDILRLDSPDPAVLGELQLTDDGTQFVAFLGRADVSSQILPRPLFLTGLEPAANYRVELINRDRCVKLSRGNLALQQRAITCSGAFLMSLGLNLPWSPPQSMWVLQGKRL